MSVPNSNPEIVRPADVVTPPEQAGKLPEQAAKPEGKVSSKFREAESFLQQKGINKENFFDNSADKPSFDLSTAIEYAKKYEPAGPDLAVMQEAETQIKDWQMPKLFNVKERAVFDSDLNKVLDDKKITGAKAESLRTRMGQAFDKYDFHRRYLDRYLKGQGAMAQILQEQKTEVGTTLTEDMAGLYKNLQTNFKKMDGTEKFVVVGGLLLATAMFLQSDSDNVKKIKESLFGILKLGGGIYVGSKIFKLATGEGPLDALNKAVTKKTALPEFWTKAFKTSTEKAMILRDSTVYLGDKPFDYLAEKYKDAKGHGKTSIEMGSVSNSDMTPEQIFTALDVFFSKYDNRSVDGRTVNLRDKYKNWNPPAKWTEVVTNELVEDKQLDLPESTLTRMADSVQGLAERGYNSAVMGAGAAWATGKEYAGKGWRGGKEYVKQGWKATSDFFTGWWNGNNKGKEPTEADFKKYVEEKLEQKMITTEQFDQYVNGTAKDEAPGFIKAFHEADKDSAHYKKNNVKFFVDDMTGGKQKIYLVAENKTGVVPGDEAFQAGIDGALTNAQEFLKDYLKTNYKPGDANYDDAQLALQNITTFAMQKGKSFYREDIATALVSMPLPGSTEFKLAKLNFTVGNDDEKGKKIGEGADLFGQSDKIDYASMNDTQKEMFRLKFYVDGNDTGSINKICEYLTNKYRTAVDKNGTHLLRESAKQRPFAIGVDNGDFEDVERFVPGFKKELYAKLPTLNGLKGRIEELEEYASNKAKDNKGERKVLKDRILNDYGYKVRLAILGDTKAQNEVSRWSGFTSFEPTKDFVNWYGLKLMNQFAPEKKD